jgi:hypothetical protein
MWNPSEKEAKQAFDYAGKSPENYNKLNEIGKRAFWQYGKSKGIFNLNTLGPKSKIEYSKYVTDDIPYASDNPMERATLARQSEQGQFDDSEQVKAKKTQDIRLLKERRLEEFTPQPNTPIKAPIRNNSLDRSQEQYSEGKTYKKSDAILSGLANASVLGAAGKGIEQDLKPGQKGYYMGGNIAGSIITGSGLAKGAGKVLGKLGLGKLVQNLGGSAIAGAAIDTTQGIAEGDTGKELAKRVGRGAIIGLAADGALLGLGKIGQGIMKKLADKQTLSAAEKAAVDKLPNEAKKEIILYVDTYGNVRKTPTTDLLLEAPKKNLPMTDEAIIASKKKLGMPAEKARIEGVKPPIANQGTLTSPLAQKPPTGAANASGVKLGKATWKNKEYDAPIEIIGDYGTINGKKYVKIKGSDTGVPLDEVRYADEVAAAKEGSPAVSKIGKEIETEMEGATHTSNNFIKEIAPTIRDAKFGGSFSMTDIYRNFKHAFGKNYEAVKKSVLDPFDAAKKRYVDEQKVYTDDLYNNVVKKLGINKNTKESSAVQWFGEGKKMDGVKETIDPQTGKKIKTANEVPYTEADLKRDFPDKWENIKEADKWFRKSYKELIDKVNATLKQIYPNVEVEVTKLKETQFKLAEQRKAVLNDTTLSQEAKDSALDILNQQIDSIPKQIEEITKNKRIYERTDYYHHFKEMTSGFEGLKNLFDTPANIDPKLVGVSEFTQPKTKWASFKQKRGLGEYKADAVGGFLDYIKAASYSIHIDPQINVFRSMAKDIAETTEQSKNANNFIKFLRGYADDLSGKTNSIDRPFLNETNRQFMNIINAGNVRIKKNTVLMSAKSALSQLANIPLGVAKVKNPIHISKGVGETLAGFVGKGKAPDAYKQSQFITERYADKLYRRFDTKLLDQPEKFASWMLESTDELGTKMIWNSVHNQAIAKGIKDPIKYADDVTRSLVAGRGIGEVPLAQKAKVFQIAAPFQLEVANQWHVMKDFINEKDFAAIPILLLGNYLYNNAVQSVTGSRVTFDPINAMVEAMGEEKTTPMQKLGRLGGEVLSNIPLGSSLAEQFMPESARMKYLGKTDPTRFGTGLMLTKGLQDPLYKLLPPMGGGQIKKSIEGLKSMQILPKDLQGNKQLVPGSYNKGKLRFPVEKTPANIAKAALFGQYSSKEAVEYFRRNGKELSEEQTKQIENWVKSGRDPNEFYDKILKDRELNKLKSELSKVNKNDKLTLAEKQEERMRISNEIKKLRK